MSTWVKLVVVSVCVVVIGFFYELQSLPTTITTTLTTPTSVEGAIFEAVAHAPGHTQ